jgi:hypothetical protein
MRARLFATEAELHQAFRIPLRATGSLSAIEFASFLLKRGVNNALFSPNSAAYFARALLADTERSCEMYVPPLNSNNTVNNGILRIVIPKGRSLSM